MAILNSIDYQQRPWLKHYPPEVPAELDFEELTLPQALARSAERYAEHTAYYFMGQRYSFQTLWQYVQRTAQALAQLGVRKGDKVSILLPDIPQLPLVNFAVQYLGAVCVMNNPLYDKKDLTQQIREAKPRFLVVFDVLFPKVKALQEEGFFEACVICHANDLFTVPPSALPKGTYLEIPLKAGMFSFTDIFSAVDAQSIQVKDQSKWQDLAVLMYTGGTTNLSKAVMLRHSNISQNVQQTRAFLGNSLEEGEERMLAIFPFFHAAGYMLVLNFAVYYGLSCALVPRRKPEEVLSPYLEVLSYYRPTFFYSIPTAVNELINLEHLHKIDLSSIKVYGMGDAPIPLAAYHRLKEAHPEASIFKAYGQTEVTALAAATPLHLPLREGSSGFPVPNVEVKIVDLEDAQNVLPANQVGEILLRCPQVMQGYYQNTPRTAKIIRDGWVHSEDAGYLDEDGWLYVLDRKEDLIYKNGRYIAPQLIDQVLFRHPKILEVCAVGIAQIEEKSMQIRLYLVLKEGEKLRKSEVLAYCRKHLPGEQIPDDIRFMDSLPKSVIGKILRRKLRNLP